MKILDLFCGAGGAATGLCQRWPHAEIIGVDIKPQPHYPFRFIRADVLALTFSFSMFDFIWASPPCQRYTQMLNHGRTNRNNHPDLIEPSRERLKDSRVPYVIENVANAPLYNPIMLCGEMFGLRVLRHRFFECSFEVRQPAHPRHNPHGAIRFSKDITDKYYWRVYGHEVGTRAQWSKAMGIDWMSKPELAQAIPPAYSKWIAEQWLGGSCLRGIL